jgi:hypothetical protein
MTRRRHACPGHHESTGKRKSGNTRHGTNGSVTLWVPRRWPPLTPRTPPTSVPATNDRLPRSGRRALHPARSRPRHETHRPPGFGAPATSKPGRRDVVIEAVLLPALQSALFTASAILLLPWPWLSSPLGGGCGPPNGAGLPTAPWPNTKTWSCSPAMSCCGCCSVGPAVPVSRSCSSTMAVAVVTRSPTPGTHVPPAVSTAYAEAIP